MKQAILYDVDGLMVDSEQLGIRTAERIMQRYDVQLTDAEKQRFIGITDKKFYRELLASRGLDLDVNQILKEHFELYESDLPNVEVFPGVADSFERFRPKYKLAVVSGSTQYQVETILQRVGAPEIGVKVTCDDVEQSKPDPQPYLTAAQRLGVKPRDCVVLEDATSGVISAKRAGMKVIGVRIGNQGRQDLSQADIIVETLNEVSIDLIESL